MLFENPEAARVFQRLIANQQAAIARKPYDGSAYHEVGDIYKDILEFGQGFGIRLGTLTPERMVPKVERTIATMEKAFDQVLLKTFILGASLTGGRRSQS